MSDPEKAKKRAASQQAAKPSFVGNSGRGLSNPVDKGNASQAMVLMQDTNKFRAGGADQSQAAAMRDGGDDICAGGLDQLLAPADKSLAATTRDGCDAVRAGAGDQRLATTMQEGGDDTHTGGVDQSLAATMREGGDDTHVGGVDQSLAATMRDAVHAGGGTVSLSATMGEDCDDIRTVPLVADEVNADNFVTITHPRIDNGGEPSQDGKQIVIAAALDYDEEKANDTSSKNANA